MVDRKEFGKRVFARKGYKDEEISVLAESLFTADFYFSTREAKSLIRNLQKAVDWVQVKR